MQIEEDTDRDRYMSPLEAKEYGIIDEIIGGDEAVFQVQGSTTDFPKTKEDYVSWGDKVDTGASGSRFKKPVSAQDTPFPYDGFCLLVFNTNLLDLVRLGMSNLLKASQVNLLRKDASYVCRLSLTPLDCPHKQLIQRM